MEKKEGIWKQVFGTLTFCNRHKFLFLSTAIFLQIASFVGKELLQMLFRLALVLVDLPNVDQYNIRYFFTSPRSLFMVLLFAFLLAFFFYVEVFTLVQVILAAKEGARISYRKILRTSLSRLRDFSYGNVLLFLLYILCTVPVASFILSSSLTDSFHIPDFITEEVGKTMGGHIALFLLFLFFMYLNMRMVYTVPLMGLKAQKFNKSVRESFAYTKKGGIRLFLTLFLYEFLLSLLAALLLYLAAFIFTRLDPEGELGIFHFLFFLLFRFTRFFFAILSKIGFLSLLVNTLPVEGSEGENAFLTEEQKYSKTTIFLLLALFVFHSTIALMDYMGREVNTDAKIIAHRGLVSAGVENTIESLEGAKAAGADMVELDIQLTKDGEFVVMHDVDLSRLTGIEKKVYDCTLSELTAMTVHQGAFSGKIPSLREFVQKAKELDMPLLIEIKPHGKEPENFSEILLKKLEEYGVEKTNPLMSLNISLMEGIEETAPEWKTGVVIPVQFGDFATENVDFYAIEDSSYNGYLMGEVQDMGKEIYVWTINEEDKIIKYLQSPVDGMITDDPEDVFKLRKDMLEDRSYYGMYERMAG